MNFSSHVSDPKCKSRLPRLQASTCPHPPPQPWGWSAEHTPCSHCVAVLPAPKQLVPILFTALPASELRKFKEKSSLNEAILANAAKHRGLLDNSGVHKRSLPAERLMCKAAPAPTGPGAEPCSSLALLQG